MYIRGINNINTKKSEGRNNPFFLLKAKVDFVSNMYSFSVQHRGFAATAFLVWYDQLLTVLAYVRYGHETIISDLIASFYLCCCYVHLTLTNYCHLWSLELLCEKLHRLDLNHPAVHSISKSSYIALKCNFHVTASIILIQQCNI